MFFSHFTLVINYNDINGDSKYDSFNQCLRQKGSDLMLFGKEAVAAGLSHSPTAVKIN